MDRKDPEPGRKTALARLATAVDLPAAFPGESATSRLRTLMNLRDPGKVLRRLRADELYFLLAGIGLEDAGGLLAYATPAQRTVVRDMETWSGWDFNVARFDRLLELASEVSSDFAQTILRETEAEVLGLRLLKTARVTVGRDTEDEDLPDWAFPSPDGIFQIACEDREQVEPTRRFVDLLYANGVTAAHELLHAVVRETVGAAEEDAFRLRDTRLQDLGFPPESERFELYEPFDLAALRERVRAGGQPVGPALDEGRGMALAAAAVDPGLRFWEALARASGRADVSAIAVGLTLLANRVLAARTRDFFEPEAWEQAAAHAVCVASIGLEDLAGDDPEVAAETLLATTPTELYRAGVEVLRPGHVQARQVVSDVGGMERLRLLGSEESEAIRALAAFPPRFWEGLAGGGPVSRDFRTSDEVRRAAAVAAEARSVVAFARVALGFDPRRDPGEPGAMPPTFANVLATAWAHGVLSGAPSLAPLTGANLRDLRLAAFDGDRIRLALRVAPGWTGATEGDRERVRAYLDRALDAVQEALGGMAPGAAVDPRFIGECLLHE